MLFINPIPETYRDYLCVLLYLSNFGNRFSYDIVERSRWINLHFRYYSIGSRKSDVNFQLRKKKKKRSY